jgi:hypothetical protein
VRGDDHHEPGRRQGALEAIDRESGGCPPGEFRTLQALCRAVVADMGLTGATVTVVPHLDSHVVAAASSPAARKVEELQFDAGEGPTRDAHRAGRPVVAGDLAQFTGRWPGYASVALACGVCAVYSFPLRVGAARLGVLSLYGNRPRQPVKEDLRIAGVYSEIATEVLIDDGGAGTGHHQPPSLGSALGVHESIYQAQGMVMIDLAVSLQEALARMRAHAFAHSQDLRQLATEIIDGKVFETAAPTMHQSTDKEPGK